MDVIRQYFYVPGQLSVVDEVKQNAAGEKFGLWSSQSHAQLEAQYPGLVVGTAAEFRTLANEAAKTAPEEITQEEFDDLLNVLPPQGWTRGGSSESFKLSEYYANDITTVVVRVDDRYFKFRDLGSLRHADVLRVIEASGILNPPRQEEEEKAGHTP